MLSARTVPTGTPIHNIRDQLFSAAERVLLRDGPDGLTSRAVTTEADVAKGILHRHFPDFNAFLAAFALTHIERLDVVSEELRASIGTATVAGTINLVCSRQQLLAHLRVMTPRGIPVAAEITKMAATYLTAERGLGRIAIDTDVDALAVTLVGGAYLHASERDDLQLDSEELRDVMRAGIGSAQQQPNLRTRAR
jgi:AcrR family transcriptional regulator